MKAPCDSVRMARGDAMNAGGNGDSSPDVIVIGAGVAGLMAAYALSQRGVQVEVFEARSRVGGRAHSTASVHGSIDLGASWFWPGEELVKAVTEQLVIPTFAQYLGGDAMFESTADAAQRLDGNPIDVTSSRFTNGAQSLAEALASALPDGILHLDNPVSAVVVEGDDVRVLHGQGDTRAAHVVVAIPPALAVERIEFTPPLPKDLRDIAERTSTWMGAMVKAVAVYNHAQWRESGLAGAAISYVGPFREFHDLSGPEGPGGAVFGFAAADRLGNCDDAAIAELFIAQLVRLFGECMNAPTEVLVTNWSREEFTTPTTPHVDAGTATYGNRIFALPVHERIHWASTETAPSHAGHLEGALRAGLAVADRFGTT